MSSRPLYKILFAVLVVFFFSCKKGSKTVKPERHDITQAVYASGKIFPVNDYKVYSKLPGYIEKILVKVNDQVAVNQPLIIIHSEISDINVSSAKNALQLASENASDNSAFLSAIRSDVGAAKAKYELDSANYIKFTNLYKENATSRVQLDQAKTAFDISRANYLKAKSSLLSTRERVSTEYQNAKLQYEAMVSNEKEYTISSVVSGKVYDIIPKEGELVNPQSPLVELGDAKEYEVELNVDETDISMIKPGQKVIYEVDAYKDRFLEGVITEVYPRINQSNKTSKVMAKITSAVQMPVYSGMSVEGNIVITEKKNTLVIPREYIFENNKVKVKGKDEPVQITTGIRDLERVEVLSGIDENTELVLP
jgi:HlyD family secretion protein